MTFKLLKTEIGCSFPAIALMTLVILLDSRHTAEICILAAFLHEGGHLLAMLCCGRRPDKIQIRLFSVDINDPRRGRGTFPQEILIIYSGILANALAALVAYGLFLLTDIPLLFNVAAANAVIGGFNLLPAATLDGGQGIFLIIMRKTSYRTAEMIINILTVLLLIPFTAVGILLVFYSKNNFSLLVVSVYLILSLALRKEHF